VLQRPQEPTEVVSEFDVAIKPETVQEYREQYPNGKPRAAWSAGIGEDGHHLLHGTETWYYQNGQKKWQAEYRAGQRTGTETYWADDGTRVWQRIYRDDGTYEWAVFDPNGKEKAKSTWKGKKLTGYKVGSL
ncbi:MAG: toxin-antitoxin system YwqK family antitoxin, partial [Planctomycetota bacterium]